MHQLHRMLLLLLLLLKPNPVPSEHTQTRLRKPQALTLTDCQSLLCTLTGLASSPKRGLKRWPCLPFDLCEQNALGCPAAPAHTRLT